MKKRAREWGFDLPGTTGKYNAITDVAGVEVGFSTLILGEPDDYKGPGSDFARTGVTAVLPRGKAKSALLASRYDLNGNGELTGTHWIDDSGFLHGPIMITNTNSIGIVKDTTSKWMIENRYYHPFVYDGREIEGCGYFCQAVGETWDGLLNDINGFHVKAENVLEALESAKSGSVTEGSVGGGTGMICHQFKGGTGSASRILKEEDGGYTVGVLVQANHGSRDFFQILGVPLNEELKDYEPILNTFAPKPGTGSIIVVVATDAPVWPIQLQKMCKRIPIGISKQGAGYENGSGDIFIAFSTANENAFTLSKTTIEILGDDAMDPLYKATAEAVEEAILNVLCAGETMIGKDHNIVYGLPVEKIVKILKYNGKIK